MSIERFPGRRSMCVWLIFDSDGWLVLARDHGWLHSSYAAALADARWLARNLGLPLRYRKAAA